MSLILGQPENLKGCLPIEYRRENNEDVDEKQINQDWIQKYILAYKWSIDDYYNDLMEHVSFT